MFEACISLTDVEIPSSVISIGKSAFFKCSSLKSITIPRGVITIGESAFYECTALENITIPDTVVSIGNKAFCACKSAENIIIGNRTETIGYGAFASCISVTNIELPNSVVRIGYQAFGNCTSLINISIPASVTYLDEGILWGCTDLKNISVDKDNSRYQSIDGNLYSKDGTILIQHASGKDDEIFILPNSVTNLECRAFIYSKSLTAIVIHNGVSYIFGGAFTNCDSITTIYYIGTEDEWSNLTESIYIPISINIYCNYVLE